VYLTAIEQLGLRPDTVRVDKPVTFGNWSPKNSHDDFRGPVTLTTALASSINTIAAQLAYEVGPKAVVETARRMGSTRHWRPIRPCVGNVRSISAGDHRRYAPFSNGGYAVMPYVIQRIRTPNGDVLFERTGSGLGKVASIESVAMMNHMLQAAVDSGTATKAAIAGWQVAGKTGTSQDYRDAWFLGYTANLTAGVWVGNDSNAPMKRVFGGTLPAAIWQGFMTKAHAGVPVAQLPGSDLMPYLAAASVGAGASRVVAQAGETRRARAVQARRALSGSGASAAASSAGCSTASDQSGSAAPRPIACSPAPCAFSQARARSYSGWRRWTNAQKPRPWFISARCATSCAAR
jgi:penicillin-binding protein 1A